METAPQDFPHLQDVLGQMGFLKTYVVIGYGFRTRGNTEEVTKALKDAAQKLVETFPWVAGQVIREGSGPGMTGLATIVPYPPGERTTPVIVKDVSDASASLDDILKAGAPMHLLGGDVFAVRKGLPDSYDESEGPAPVLVIQANIIEGGVFLVFQGNHHAMDMNGMAHMMRLFSKALRSEPFSEAEITHGNRERLTAIKLLGPDDQKADVSMMMVQPAPPANHGASAAAPNVQWVYLHLDGPKLAELKAAALKSGAGEGSQQWISTDDALSAFIFQRITAARMKRMDKKEPQITFCRAVNGRRFLDPPLPKEYMGHMVHCTFATVPLDSTVATSDVGALARQIRADILSIKSNDIESIATALHELDDKNALAYGASLNMSGWDLMMSSFAGLGLNHLDFGDVLGGRPVFSKRPRFAPIEGLLYFMPKTIDGDVDVAVCLRVEDIQTLRNDEEFLKYGSYVG
ncbi:trichothecene 3-o-acetyltransferase [Diaporthe amygdali]|uniref:trichothecene 3-o-acetyltransferase n=1 Tax=Phomopsis amygdali TaxID=1214568 RepID=UPI0022FF3CE8|nr:trichothecene 3-o-acetyltransferase [Diaporthe amygdali]KAJ0119643.1 trichothecene 3-o-acetyltransferase [Diaporthe amygdali]